MSSAPYAAIPDVRVIERTAAALESKGIQTYIAEDRHEALQTLTNLLPDGARIYCNPSTTLEDLGFLDYVRQSERYHDLHISTRNNPNISKRESLVRRLDADYMLGSVNALTEAGELLFASHSGSQLGPYAYSADHVIWVVGAQKICPTLADAFRRVREYAHPLEDRRIGLPQGHSLQIGKWLVIENELPGRATLILVKESLGF